jgi:hypothetical protein
MVGILLLLVALPAGAQEEERGPITWFAFSKVKPGMTEEAVKLTLEDSEFMDGLMADGTILSWGIAVPINHTPGDLWNHLMWVTVSGWEKIDIWAGASMGRMAEMDEATTMANKERFEKIYVEGSHFDEVVRHSVFSLGSAGETKYFYAGEFAARDGKGKEMVELFKEAVVPVLDPLVADGTMTSYGVYSPELHLDVDWTHRFWYGLPGLGSIDKMTKAFAGLDTPAFGAWADSVFEAEGHYDKVLMILHYSK